MRPSPRWNREGVASTVGTIMALMVFMALLSVFTNQYVPVWMEDNEAKHMNTVESQFGMIRWGIDNQILAGQFGGVTDVSVYNPITMGSEGVPMFASPTQGTFSILPNKGSSRVDFTYDTGIGGGNINVNSISNGTLEMEAPNRYYVPQTLVYENDAIILVQPDGMAMKSYPQFIVRQEGTGFKFVFSQITLFGVNKTYAGTTTTGIHTSLKYVNSTTYSSNQVTQTGFQSNIVITINSEYASAWWSYLNDYMKTTGMVSGVDYTIPAVAPVGNVLTIALTQASMSSITLHVAYFDVLMGEGIK